MVFQPPDMMCWIYSVLVVYACQVVVVVDQSVTWGLVSEFKAQLHHHVMVYNHITTHASKHRFLVWDTVHEVYNHCQLSLYTTT